MKTTKEVLEIALEDAEDAQAAIAFLEDGAAMAEMGINDEDQEAVEAAHEILTGPVYTSGIKYINKTDDATTETRWFHVDGEVWGLCDDGVMLDEDGIPTPEGEKREIKEAIEEYMSAYESHTMNACNSQNGAVEIINSAPITEGLNHVEFTAEMLAGHLLADATIEDLGDNLQDSEAAIDENLTAQSEILIDEGAVFNSILAKKYANRLIASA